MSNYTLRDECLTMAQKNANDKRWYKDKIDNLDTDYDDGTFSSMLSLKRNMVINYDLFNNIINTDDVKHVLKPYGYDDGQIPPSFNNKDIVSGKIKAILGMEKKSPFTWKAVSVNAEATTRKEQEQMGMIREYVISSIMQPIIVQAQMQAQEQMQGRELTEEEAQQVRQQVDEQIKSMTPEEVKRYMEREYQEPAEVMANQLLEYLTRKTNFRDKMNDCLKHGLLSTREIAYVGTFNGDPEIWVVNPMRFHINATPDTQFIEDSESASCEYRMTPSEVVRYFGTELTDKQISDLYQGIGKTQDQAVERWLEVDTSTFAFDPRDSAYLRVLHCVWKSCRKVGFLTYMDENGEIQQTMVSDEYVMDEDGGDIGIEWEWIPEVYEGWKINTDIYVRMRPVPGQFKDPDNIYECKLPYYGVIHDGMNSSPTSIMDRLRPFQYLYDIAMYRVENLMASDKGKKLLMNIDAIPQKFKTKTWQYMFDNTSFAYFANSGEGFADANTQAKVLDMSLISDIDRYINFAEAIRIQAGRSIGVTDQMEGQIEERAAVQNTNQAIALNSNILEPIFEYHRQFKRNVLTALLEQCKVAWSGSGTVKKSYVLDDLSEQMLNVDMGLLDSTTMGIFLCDDNKNDENKQIIRELSFSAMQNQTVELSDIMSILKIDDTQRAAEILRVAEERRKEREQQAAEAERQAKMEEIQMQQDWEREKYAYEERLIIVKEEERRKTELAKQALLGASFNPDVDTNDNKRNDFVEIADNYVKNKLAQEKLDIEKIKLRQEKELREKELEIQEKKNELDYKKAITAKRQK